jgi:hypothetical protein
MEPVKPVQLVSSSHAFDTYGYLHLKLMIPLVLDDVFVSTMIYMTWLSYKCFFYKETDNRIGQLLIYATLGLVHGPWITTGANFVWQVCLGNGQPVNAFRVKIYGQRRQRSLNWQHRIKRSTLYIKDSLLVYMVF